MTRPLTDLVPIRTVLVADGLLCLAMGAGLIALRVLLAEPTGLTPGFLTAAGGLLVPVGAFILAVAAGWVPFRFGLAVVVAGNFAWAAASVILPLTGWVAPTSLGLALILGQALAVAGIAVLEARGLRAGSAMA